MLIPSSLDPDIVFTEHLGRIDVVLAGPVVERHMVQLAALAHRVAQTVNLMSEHVGAHPGADFGVAVDDPFPGLKSEVALESVLQRNRFPGQRPNPGAVGS